MSHPPFNKKRQRDKGARNPAQAGNKQPYPKVALIGFRGVGKSSIARELRKLWDTKLISLDEYIEKKNQGTIKEIVREKGWDFFREEETECLKDISQKEEGPLLLDTGGGIVETVNSARSTQNIKILKEEYFSLYLFMPKDKIIRRLQKARTSSSRPHLSEELTEIYDRREPWYKEAALSMIDVSDTPMEDIIRRILGNFR